MSWLLIANYETPEYHFTLNIRIFRMKTVSSPPKYLENLLMAFNCITSSSSPPMSLSPGMNTTFRKNHFTFSWGKCIAEAQNQNFVELPEHSTNTVSGVGKFAETYYDSARTAHRSRHFLHRGDRPKIERHRVWRDRRLWRKYFLEICNQTKLTGQNFGHFRQTFEYLTQLTDRCRIASIHFLSIRQVSVDQLRWVF